MKEAGLSRQITHTEYILGIERNGGAWQMHGQPLDMIGIQMFIMNSQSNGHRFLLLKARITVLTVGIHISSCIWM